MAGRGAAAAVGAAVALVLFAAVAAGAWPVPPPPGGGPDAVAALEATVAALEAAATEDAAERSLLEVRLAALEEQVGLLLVAQLDQIATDGFLQGQVDDLRARVDALEAAGSTPAASPAP
jgi:hypothetical protein